jgi:hypothetical protein
LMNRRWNTMEFPAQFRFYVVQCIYATFFLWDYSEDVHRR